MSNKEELYNQSTEEIHVWATLQQMDESNINYSTTHEETQNTLQVYFDSVKDNFEWESVEEMVSSIQSKIRLTGWDWAYALTSFDGRNK